MLISQMLTNQIAGKQSGIFYPTISKYASGKELCAWKTMSTSRPLCGEVTLAAQISQNRVTVSILLWSRQCRVGTTRQRYFMSEQ